MNVPPTAVATSGVARCDGGRSVGEGGGWTGKNVSHKLRRNVGARRMSDATKKGKNTVHETEGDG